MIWLILSTFHFIPGSPYSSVGFSFPPPLFFRSSKFSGYAKFCLWIYRLHKCSVRCFVLLRRWRGHGRKKKEFWVRNITWKIGLISAACEILLPPDNRILMWCTAAGLVAWVIWMHPGHVPGDTPAWNKLTESRVRVMVGWITSFLKYKDFFPLP